MPESSKIINVEVSEVDDRRKFPKSGTPNHPLVDDQDLVFLTHSLGFPYLRKPQYGLYMYINHRLVLTKPGHLIVNTMVNS